MLPADVPGSRSGERLSLRKSRPPTTTTARIAQHGQDRGSNLQRSLLRALLEAAYTVKKPRYVIGVVKSVWIDSA